jgi:hypothetical protein
MIDYLKIGETEYPVKFGLNALALYCDEVGIKLGELDKIGGSNTSLMDLIKLAFWGLKDGARSEGKPFDMTVENIADLLDDDPSGLIVKIVDIFKKQFVGNPQKPAKKNAGKSRSTT